MFISLYPVIHLMTMLQALSDDNSKHSNCAVEYASTDVMYVGIKTCSCKIHYFLKVIAGQHRCTCMHGCKTIVVARCEM